MQKLKAEALDVLQYFYGSVHEPLVRCIVRFEGHIDEEVLKNAFDLSSEALPVIKCRFDCSGGRPCWRYEGYPASAAVQLMEAEGDPAELAKRLAVAAMDIFSEPQVKLYVARGKETDALAVVMNHMVCDGTGFKEYLYLLCRLYTALAQNAAYSERFEPKDRGERAMLQSFSPGEKMRILRLRSQLDKQKNGLAVPFAGDKAAPFIETRRIGCDVLGRAKAFAKRNGATLNDVFLTAYARLLASETGVGRIVLPCPVDLRRFIKKGREMGIGNLTSNYILDITLEPDEPFAETLKKTALQMSRQKEGAECVKPVMLYTLAFRILPFGLLQKFFAGSFTIPAVSYTNLGILDDKKFRFGDTAVSDAVITGAVKYVPYFQISISTFKENCTLSSNLYGTAEDREKIKGLLARFEGEIAANAV
jgi:NRPS condensation-like uncharacterized protein